MRNLFLAALAAVGIHGLLFLWEFDLPDSRQRPEPECRTLSMILISRPPAKPEIKPVENRPASPPKPPVRPPAAPPEKDNAPKPVQPVKKKPVVAPRVKPLVEESFSPSPQTSPQTSPPVNAPVPARSDIPKGPAGKTGSETVASGSGSASNIVREAVPMYRSNTPPDYPRWARKRGWQGTVLLEILVDVQGKARDIRIHESSGYDVLDEAAASAAKKWMFVPGMRGDLPVEMWVRVPVAFQLQ